MESIDKLTGLQTRETLEHELGAFLDNASSNDTPVGLIMVDLDHFKKVNDTYGHQKGDAVLKGASELIMRIISGRGKAYRYGGEEIVVLLPNHNTEETIAVAERTRCSFESQQIEDLVITASFGVSSFPNHATDPADLLRAADEALYDAKNRGRNLVRVHGEPIPVLEEDREPRRKKPGPGALTNDQMNELYLAHFRGEIITCPNDGAILEVMDVTGIGDSTRSLSVICPVCGLDADLQTPER